MGETRFAAITTAIIVLSYIVAMTVSSLEKVLAYVGSTGSTSISFILPGLFYYKISSPDSPHHQKLIKEDDDGAGLPHSRIFFTAARSGKFRLLVTSYAAGQVGRYHLTVTRLGKDEGP